MGSRDAYGAQRKVHILAALGAPPDEARQELSQGAQEGTLRDQRDASDADLDAGRDGERGGALFSVEPYPVLAVQISQCPAGARFVGQLCVLPGDASFRVL